jgi:hypothetical protein
MASALATLIHGDGPSFDMPDRPVDRNRLSALLEWHRLTPLFAHIQQRSPSIAGLPTNLDPVMEDARRRGAAQQMLLALHLRELFDALTRAGIVTMALKGVSLAERLYPEPGLREMSDIDILVPDDAVSQAEVVLTRLGYRPQGDAAVREAFRRHHHHAVPYVHVETGAMVELHWALTRPGGPYAMDVAAVWERAIEDWVAGAQTRRMDVIDELAYLAAHFLNDRRALRPGALLHLADILLALEQAHGTVEWSAAAQRLRAHGLDRAFVAVVHMGYFVTGAPWLVQIAEAFPAGTQPDREALSLFVAYRVLDGGPEVWEGLAHAMERPGMLGFMKGLADTLRGPQAWVPGGDSTEGTPLATSRPPLVTQIRNAARALPRAVLAIPATVASARLHRWLAASPATREETRQRRGRQSTASAGR